MINNVDDKEMQNQQIEGQSSQLIQSPIQSKINMDTLNKINTEFVKENN